MLQTELTVSFVYIMYLVLFLSYLIVLLCCLLVGEYIFLAPPPSQLDQATLVPGIMGKKERYSMS